MKELPLNVSRMNIYVNNVLNIYLILEKLEQQIIKRFKKGKEVSLEHLVKCSSMYNLARLSANTVQEYEYTTPTRQDKKEFRIWFTNTLIQDCKAVASL